MKIDGLPDDGLREINRDVANIDALYAQSIPARRPQLRVIEGGKSGEQDGGTDQPHPGQ